MRSDHAKAAHMTTAELHSELKKAEDAFDARGDHGGSPGEWAVERMDEIRTEMKKRQATAAPNPRHSSESNEHYTPIEVVEAARRVVQNFDLDPASCETANRTVLARRFFTSEDNGYRKAWHGRVFLNPPGGKSDDHELTVLPKCRETGACGQLPGHTHTGVESNQKKWWFKLSQEFTSERVMEAVFVCFSVELLQTTQVDTPSLNGLPLPLPLDFPICFPSRRVPYDHIAADGKRVSGTSPPHSSCIIYLGPQVDRFVKEFTPLGRVRR